MEPQIPKVVCVLDSRNSPFTVYSFNSDSSISLHKPWLHSRCCIFLLSTPMHPLPPLPSPHSPPPPPLLCPSFVISFTLSLFSLLFTPILLLLSLPSFSSFSPSGICLSSISTSDWIISVYQEERFAGLRKSHLPPSVVKFQSGGGGGQRKEKTNEDETKRRKL